MSTNNTLKLSDERLREVHAALCGETTMTARWPAHGCYRIVPPTPDELASIVNQLISLRTAVAMLQDD